MENLKQDKAHSPMVATNSRNNFESCLDRAKYFFEKLRYRVALRYIERCLRLEPYNVKALFLKSRILLQNETTEGMALVIIDQAIKLDSKSAECIAQKGRILGLLNKEKQSIKLLKKSYKLNPKNIFVLESLGRHYRKAGKSKQALVIFEKVRKISETSSIVNSIGITYSALGNEKKAGQFFKKAIKLNPSISRFMENYVISLGKQGNSAKALSILNKSMEKNPDAPLFGLKSLLLEDKNRMYDALKNVSKGLVLHPNNIDLLEIKAQLNFKMENFIDSLITLEILQEMNGVDLALNFRRQAIITTETGKLEKALILINKSLKIKVSPQSIGIKVNILQQLKRNNQALKLVSQLLKIDKNNVLGIIMKHGLLVSRAKSKAEFKTLELLSKKIISLNKTSWYGLFSNIHANINLQKDKNAYQTLKKLKNLIKNHEINLTQKQIEETVKIEIKLLILTGKAKNALNKVNQLLRKQPLDEGLLRNKIFALYQLNKYEEINKITISLPSKTRKNLAKIISMVNSSKKRKK